MNTTFTPMFRIFFCLALLLPFASEAQTFSFALSGDTLLRGIPEDELYTTGTFTNNSASAITISVKRLENNIPAGWNSAICLDVCLAPQVSSTSFVLAAGQTQTFSLHFYTTPGDLSGNVLLELKNEADTSNKYTFRIYGETDHTLGGLFSKGKAKLSMNIYPNPIVNEGFIDFRNMDIQNASVKIFDVAGREIRTVSNIESQTMKINKAEFVPGVYVVEFRNAAGIKTAQRFVVK